MREKVGSIVKTMVQSLNGLAGEVAGVYRQPPDTMINGLQWDFLHFILYLAKADGDFTENENNFIKKYFGEELTIDRWEEYIDKVELDINKPNLPITFEFFVKADNVQYNCDNTIESAVEIFMTCFKTVGELFLGVDGDVSEKEVEKLSVYINLMQDFYEKNTERIHINKPEPIDVDFAKMIAARQKELKTESVILNKATKQKCNNITVQFFDRNYSVSEDVLVFLECRNFTSKGLIKLLDEARRLMKQYQKIGGEKAVDRLSKDVLYIQQVMKSIVKDVHEDLLRRKIYDVDECEFYERIASIKRVEVVATEIMKNMLDLATRVHNQNQAMRERAYISAASNITGSGVKVYTNSFSSLMVHSAIENSILKSQAEKAEQEYEQILKKISISAEDQFSKIFAEGIFKQFLPTLPEIFNVFQEELLKNYLLELAKHNQFDIDNIEKYNENKSITILENIKYTEDKKSLLIQAFEECPFNIDIYEKMLELGCFDIDTMKDAKKIFKGSELDDLLEEKIWNNLKNLDVVKDYVAVLAYYKGTDERDILLFFYRDLIEKIKQGYCELFSLCIDSVKLDVWIKKNIDSDIDKITVHTEEQVKNKVDLWIKRKIKDSEFAELSRLKLLTIEEIRMKDSTVTTLEEAKAEYAARIVSQIMEYIKEANIRKTAYEKAYGRYNSVLDKKCKIIDARKVELKAQSIFAFSKKKEIKAEIKELQKDLENFMCTEPVKFKEDYYGVYNKKML